MNLKYALTIMITFALFSIILHLIESGMIRNIEKLKDCCIEKRGEAQRVY